ncbi:MAG: hypothetical protein ACXWID_09535 [Pyrinomonadaceae bacterium]
MEQASSEGSAATLDAGGKATALALGPDNSSLIVANEGGVLII